MKIILNQDKTQVNRILKALRENDGYCPCRPEHIADNKCVCKEFRE